jgi:hypothetical protein
MDSPNSPDKPQAGWTFKPEQSGDNPKEPAPSQPAEQTEQNPPGQKSRQEQAVSWTASEFIANHKGVGWYIVLLASVAAIAILTLLITHDLISTITILVVGALFAMLAGKKPRQLSYKLDSSGITIGGKFYPYGAFKSFAIVDDGAIGCINFLPLKRFMPEISIYYPPEEEKQIIGVLSGSLPHDQRPEHGFDKLMKKIKF